MAVCGIYKITNKETNECYIGQSIDVYGRLKQHSSNKYDENDWHQRFQKYPELYTFEVLVRCKPEDLNDEEAYYIYKYNSVNNGYNKTKGNHSPFTQTQQEEQLNNKIIQEDIVEESLFQNVSNINSDNTDILLTLNPVFFLNNTNQLNSSDLDLLLYYVYTNLINYESYPAHYLKLFNKIDKGGFGYRQYTESNNKLIKLGLIKDNKPIENIITGKYTVRINFKQYINLKSEPSKYSLVFLCLIEYFKKYNKRVMTFKELPFSYQKPADTIRHILKPTIELLNKYYYINPITYQILKKGHVNDKIIFNIK